MPFRWLKPEKEPKRAHIVEIGNDEGDHVIVNVKNKTEAKKVEKIVRNAGGTVDTDEAIYHRSAAAQDNYNHRDHSQLRYHHGAVVNPNEDLEPEVDDDSINERNEVPAEGGW